MITNILKNMFLGFFGVFIIASIFTILEYFNPNIVVDRFTTGYAIITWSGYIIFKMFAEYYDAENKKQE